MSLKNLITDVTEDLSSLEVATLTLNVGVLELGEEPKDEDNQLDATLGRVTTVRTELLALLGNSATPRSEIRKKKQQLRQAKRDLDEVKKAIGSYGPKDLFSKIRASLPNADLVAYSRFELGGDSTNFINSNPEVRGLVNKHNQMVAAAQESRKALFATILNIGDDDQS